jgi:hypothetical protein
MDDLETPGHRLLGEDDGPENRSSKSANDEG